ERIGIKTTRLRSLSGEQVVFPNSELVRHPLQNYERMDGRRVQFTLAIEYASTLEQVRQAPELVRAAVEAQPGARFERAHFASYTDSALALEAAYDVEAPDYGSYMDTRHAVNVEILRRFREAGIEFASPTSAVRLGRNPLQDRPATSEVAG